MSFRGVDWIEREILIKEPVLHYLISSSLPVFFHEADSLSESQTSP